MRSAFRRDFTLVVNKLSLTEIERDVIFNRYMELVRAFEVEYTCTYIAYTFLSNYITIAGVFITALVSLTKFSEGTEASDIIFWIVWSTSIGLTLANKWLGSYNIHKKYMLAEAALEKLHSEGYSFVAGINVYKGYDIPTRHNLFCARIEIIKTKTIEYMNDIESTSDNNDLLALGSMIHSRSGAPSQSVSQNTAATSRTPVSRTPAQRTPSQQSLMRHTSQYDNIYDTIAALEGTPDTNVGDTPSTDAIEVTPVTVQHRDTTGDVVIDITS